MYYFRKPKAGETSVASEDVTPTHSRYGITRLTSSICSIISPEQDHHDQNEGSIYRIHTNSFAGLMHGTGRSFLTYSIYLFFVEEEFKNVPKANWNPDYPKAAQIFAENASGVMIRGCIQALHSQLYRRGSSDRTTKGIIRSGDEFINIFLKGAKEGWVFTYVLHNNKFKCSETGITLTQDLSSKHAVHANVATSVNCAGEFHFQPDGDSYKLILDNNSGTYAPTMEHLDCLKNTLQRNFPGLIVDICDYKSQKLHDYMDALNGKKSNEDPINEFTHIIPDTYT